MRKILFPILCLFSFPILHSQSVAVNTDGSSPDASAMLDVKSTSKGILIPKMTTVQRDAIVSPQTGLMIFQTDNVGGYYYNSGTSGTPAWVRVGDVAYPTSATNKITNFSAGVTPFIVPAGVGRIFFEMVGGGGGWGGTYTPASGTGWGGGGGGGGAFAAGYITVTPGETLTLTVGGPGTNGTNGTSPTAGTSGSASTIVSGATTIVTCAGGNAGAAGSSGGAGAGGIGSFALVVSPSRCVLSSYIPQVFPGGTGLGITAPVAITLTGDPGTVATMGNYNIFALINHGVAGGGSVNSSTPWYGMGAGYGAGARQGYIVLYW